MMVRNSIIVAALVIAFIVTAMLHRQIRSRITTVNIKMADCEQMLNQLQQRQTELQQIAVQYNYQNDLNQLQLWEKSQVQWAAVLKHVMTEMPESMWLERITAQCNPGRMHFQKINYVRRDDFMNTSYQVAVEGKTSRYQDVEQFTKALAKNRWVQSVAIADVKRGKTSTRFKLRCTFN